MANESVNNSMIDNNIFITTNINPETTNDVIIKLTQWVNVLPIGSLCKKTKDAQKIFTPYEPLPDNQATLNIYIDSPGGQQHTTFSLLTLINMARARGTIVRTYNLNTAHSSASIIAICGTQGYRYMAEDASNLVHFGSKTYTYNHETEVIDKNNAIEHSNNKIKKIYLSCTKLTSKEITKHFNHEYAGFLNAKQCLEKGLCDWVILNDGRFVNKM